MGKIGLFGGTFNPIHDGHLHIAQSFAAECQLDSVIFLPAGDPYHKKTDLVIAEHRLNMVQLAVQQQPIFAVSDCDVVRTGATYTIDTIQIFKQHYPSAQLYWLMGMDSLMKLHTWKNWQTLVRQVKIAVAKRTGDTLAQAPQPLHIWLGEAIKTNNLILLNADEVAISSSQIRKAIAAGENPRAWLPELVADYIQQHHLYQ